MPKGDRNIERIEFEEVNDRFVKDFNLTPFMMEATELIYKTRAIRVSQIARLLGYNIGYVRRELSKLYKNRFIDRRFPWEEKQKNGNKGSVEAIYMLDEAGKILIAGMCDYELKEVKWKPTENLLKYEKLKHTIECSEILARMHEECRNAYMTVLDYKGEKHLWNKYTYNNFQYELCPDSFIKILKDKNAYSFFIENDEATMDVNSFLVKIPKYDNYKLSGLYEETYDICPRVLVITTSKERALILAKEVNKKQKSKVDFLFTWHDMFYEKPFGDKTFIHTSIEHFQRTYSMFDDIPEEARTGVKRELEKAASES